MRKAALICVSFFIISLGFGAQDMEPCNIPVDLKLLTSKATDVVDINLYGKMFQFAGNFLNGEDLKEAQIKEIIENLNGICVRSFTFDKEGQYTEEDIEALHSQFDSPAWSRAVDVRSKSGKDNVGVYFRTDKDSITGLSIIASQPLQLTFVYIDGLIDPEHLANLSGQFGIPEIEMGPESKPAKN